MSAATGSYFDSALPYLRWVPLLTPALKEGVCEVDRDLLRTRADLITYLAMGVFFSTVALQASFPVVLVASVSWLVLPALIQHYDRLISETAADERAINEYLGGQVPTAAATSRIWANAQLARDLLDREGDPNKVDVKTFVRCFSQDQLEGLQWLLRSEKFTLSTARIIRELPHVRDSALFKCMLDCLKNEDFSSSDLSHLWAWAPVSCFPLLQQRGFSLNVKDETGRTPLLICLDVCQSDLLDWSAEEIQEMKTRIEFFLNNGVDRLATFVDKDGIEKNAMQFNKTSAFVDILKA